jgi:hypothetical protein
MYAAEKPTMLVGMPLVQQTTRGEGAAQLGMDKGAGRGLSLNQRAGSAAYRQGRFDLLVATTPERP